MYQEELEVLIDLLEMSKLSLVYQVSILVRFLLCDVHILDVLTTLFLTHLQSKDDASH